MTYLEDYGKVSYKFDSEPSVAVITPTTYSDYLHDCNMSVSGQTHDNITHIIVVDGPDWPIPRIAFPKSRRITLPYNTGGKGYYGHRIYAAIPHLLDHDYIAFLDEDNWYRPEHIESLVSILESDTTLDFAYSLRSIHSKNGNHLLDDNCESLGTYSVWPALQAFSRNQTVDPKFEYLIDTSSFLFRRKFIQENAHLWHAKWGGDRNFLHNVRTRSRFASSWKHTLCYRLDGNPGSVTKDFFEAGNEYMLNHYAGSYPWLK